jgi:1-acyl-sn-glycerol-3-phosphate acyltransferase
MPNEIAEVETTDIADKAPTPMAPSAENFAVLDGVEQMGFRLAHLMNIGRAKRLMTFCQRHFGSLWIYLTTYNLMNVFGIENVNASEIERPLILVANHRSFFDMYTVSSVMFRRAKRPINLYFPVRAKFFYDNPIGWAVNFLMGWFSMYPPFFREAGEARKREFDKYSMLRLIQLAHEGHGNVIGFHPEGKRNTEGDTYDLLKAQPGIGKVIHEARPQVIPVFIAGLGNKLLPQVFGNWFGGPQIRVWFGEVIDLDRFYQKPNRLRTHKEIADHLMDKVAELADRDRAWAQSDQGFA